MTPEETVRSYLEHNYQLVFWPAVGDVKGPREVGWPQKRYIFEDYRTGYRVGIKTGVEVEENKFLHDVDIDWSPGSLIAQLLIPQSNFVFGRLSKRVSHCFYITSEPIASLRYEDIDKTCLIELRGTKANGEIGLQSMVPPSIWSKDALREPLIFVKTGGPSYVEIETLKRCVLLAAVAMVFAKHLGVNGFGHQPRLAWAGFLLRAGFTREELIKMGEAISIYCNNNETHDVPRAIDSTIQGLAKDGKKVAGGPTLARHIGKNGKAVLQLINEWLGRDNDFIRVEGAIVKDNQDNIRRAIQLLGIELSYQSFAERLTIREGEQPRLLDDQFVNRTWLRVDREFHFRPQFMFFEKVLWDIAHDHSFHPVRDYLESLTWDGEPRIDNWLHTFGGVIDVGRLHGAAIDNASESDDSKSFLEAVSSIVLIAAVRRVKHPGCKYDEMLVLESEQGLNKSSALRALCPVEDWFSDDLPLDVDAKEIIERTLGKWIIEASDLVGGRKADRDHLKSMLSRQTDGPARMAYARFPIERPRQFIIIGTTNSREYLADMTGARRFWPVQVQRFDVEGIVRHRDQLWAEAVVRENNGESIRLPEALWGDAGVHQEQRREVDAWENVIEEQISFLEPSTIGRVQITADALWMAVGIGDVARRDRQGARRIAEIMQRFGFTRTNVRGEKKVETGYIRDPGDRAQQKVDQDNSAAEQVLADIKYETEM